MPASRFFAMLGAARVLRSQEYVWGCYLSRAPAVSDKGFEELVEFFGSMGIEKERPADVEVPQGYLKGEEARAVMMGIFGSDHRTGGGRRIPIH